MTNKYLDLFNQQIQQKQSFIYAMAEVIEQYSEHYWDKIVQDAKNKQTVPVKDEICIALSKFYDALFDFIDSRKSSEELVGRVIINYEFNTTMPQDFLEVFEAAKKQELSLLLKISKKRAPSQLVADCENQAAAEGFSPKVIFAQTAILEKALINKEISQQSHVEETEAKIAEWTCLLYKKFAEVILESTNLEQLNALVSQHFKKDLTLGLMELENFKIETDSQIEYLEEKKFFEQYYAKTHLADKYDFVYNFYQDLKTKSVMTSELKMTLSGLFFGIVTKAYQPMDAKKFELMKLRNGTVENVFNGVRAWMKKNYATFNEKDLYCELVGKLQQEEETFKVWEEVSHRILDAPQTYRTYQPLMRNLYTMKYAGDPNQDPKALLKQLPQPAAFPHSPVKKKSNVKTMHALSCTEEETRRLINLNIQKKVL